MEISRREFGPLALGMSSLVALSACSGDGDSNGGEPAATQELRIGVATLPVNLDVLQNSAEGTIVGPMQHVLEPLIKRDGDDFIPWLAESWENPDELTWVFHMNPAAVFSDGAPVTAEDARASLGRLVDSESPLAPLFASVDSIEATDDTTLTFTTTGPLGTLLTSLSLVLVGQGDRIDDSDYWSSPVGSGPFVLDEYVADQRIVFTNNADYWGTPSEIESITYVSMPEETARISALASAEVDVVSGISADAVPEVESLDDVEFNSVLSYQTQFIWFNSEREPFTDARVRRALWHALDLEQIIGDLYGSEAVVSLAPVTQEVFGAPALEPYAYDPELAQELLAEAGYADGFSSTIQFSNAGGDQVDSFTQAVISAWAAVGVTVEPLSKEHAIWLEDLLDLNWDMNTQGAGTTSGDADYALARLYTCGAERLGYCNEEYDDLVMEARESIDQDERVALYAEASQILWDDAPAIWVADTTTNTAYRSYVDGLTTDPAGRNDYSGITILDH